jgi:hypothetical protein
MSNFKDVGSATGGNPVIGKDAPTNSFVEQRLRLKFSSGEENVKAVAFFEIDYSAWGDAAGMTKNDAIWGTGNATSGGLTGSYLNTISGTASVPGTGAGRNTGGALGADRINLETKNVYLWFKVPNTPVDITVGMQNQTDAYAGLLFGAADMAGIFVNGKVDPVTLTFGWAKLYENATAKWDDSTLYVAAAKFSPVKEVKLGLNFYYLQDDTQSTTAITAINPVGNLPTDPGAGPYFKRKIYTPGVDFAFNAGPATLSGFALYQFGKYRDFVASSSASSDIDVSGYAADLRADLNAGPGKVFVEGLYISGGTDNPTTPGNKFKSVVTLSDVNASPGGNSAFGRTDMSILLFNNDDINCSQAIVGTAGVPAGGGSSSPSNGGRGIWHAAAGYTQKLGDRLTAKVGAGYLAATKKFTVADATRKGKAMGTELNANVNYNIMKGLDFGVYGAYAWLGDYFKSNVAGAVEPDNAYETHMRLNYAF